MGTQVFISWSGDLSKKLAEAVREWLPATLQFVKPYFTPVDIEKGSRWVPDVATELSKSHVGIICLTKESLSSPWILLEAGALSKNLDRSRVCPLLFGLEPADVTGPLAIFQATRFTREEFKGLVETINNVGGESKLGPYVLEEAFDTRWSRLSDRVDKILAEYQPATQDAGRPVPEMVKEILELTRANAREREIEAARNHERRIKAQLLMDKEHEALARKMAELERHLSECQPGPEESGFAAGSPSLSFYDSSEPSPSLDNRQGRKRYIPTDLRNM